LFQTCVRSVWSWSRQNWSAIGSRIVALSSASTAARRRLVSPTNLGSKRKRDSAQPPRTAPPLCRVQPICRVTQSHSRSLRPRIAVAAFVFSASSIDMLKKRTFTCFSHASRVTFAFGVAPEASYAWKAARPASSERRCASVAARVGSGRPGPEPPRTTAAAPAPAPLVTVPLECATPSKSEEPPRTPPRPVTLM